MPDFHAPYQHRHTLDFLTETYRKWKCDKVRLVGDEIDMHRISRHTPEPDAPSIKEEIKKARRFMKKMYRAFHGTRVCYSNHPQRLYKVAKELGIPADFLKTIPQLLEAPKSWVWEPEFKEGGVLYFHGEGYGGNDGALKAAITRRMSVAIGHWHSNGGVLYQNNGFNTVFGLNAGCLIDIEAPAFRYAKGMKNKPTLGCGVVISKDEAYFVPMV